MCEAYGLLDHIISGWVFNVLSYGYENNYIASWWDNYIGVVYTYY